MTLTADTIWQGDRDTIIKGWFRRELRRVLNDHPEVTVDDIMAHLARDPRFRSLALLSFLKQAGAGSQFEAGMFQELRYEGFDFSVADAA